MSLSQAKIDLAVLYKLHQNAEFDGGPSAPEDIARYFQCKMPLRRVEIALQELLSKGDVDREYDPRYAEEGLWQITRSGLERVDRALRVPTTFIARLHGNGDDWLESDEAAQAVLKRIAPDARITIPDVAPVEATISATMPPISINVSPHFTNTQAGTTGDSKAAHSAMKAGWWSVWGTWIGSAIGLAALIWVLHAAKVI